ncbi:MAG: ABC transporter permease [Nitrospinae bacterium]|nr:ABC transporter permease [Nitrospinota bacterium]
MIERIKRMVIKEFIQIFRDPRMKAMVLGAPLMQMLLFGYAVTFDVRNVRLAVYDGDMTYESRELVRRFEASGYFTLTRRLESAGEARDTLDRGGATIVLVMERGFSEDIKARKTAMAQVLADGTDSNTAMIAISYATGIIGRFGTDTGGAKIAAMARPMELKTRVWYNPDLKSRNYNVPGVIAFVIMLLSLLLTSMAIVREREIGTIEQLMVTPLKPVELILGKTIPFALIGFLDMFVVITVAVFWFDIPIKGSITLLAGCTAIYLLSTLGIGLFISTIAATQQQALMATFLIFAPSVLLSGFMFPVENMPVFFQYVTLANPLRHFLVIIRGIFLKGIGLEALWPQALALLLLGTIFLTLSSMRFRKKLG